MNRIGAWEVNGEAGRGASGRVLRGRGPRGEDVAIKLVVTPGTAAAERFEREVHLLRELGEEDGFVPVLDAGRAPRGLYLVMPFLPGGTLRLEEALDLVEELARALGAAHARGIGYVPPEQMRDAKSAGPAADVFALGAVLYECLAGEPAFAAEDVVSLLETTARGAYAPLRKLRPDVPAWVAAVVARALALEPDRRYPDAAALADALARGGAPRRSRWPVVAGALVGVLAGAVALLAGTARGLVLRLGRP